MGVGGLVCALVAALVSLTLLPAILAALGPRVNALSPQALAGRAAPRRLGRARRLLVPPLARDHAPPRAGRGGRRGAADRARAAVPRHQVHRRRRRACSRATTLPASSTTRSRPSSRPTARRPIYVAARGGRGRPRGGRALRAAARRDPRRGRRADACSRRGASTGSTSWRRGRPLGERAKEVVERRAGGDGAGAGAGRRRDRRVPRPAEGAERLAAARARRSSPPRRSSSCS